MLFPALFSVAAGGGGGRCSEKEGFHLDKQLICKISFLNDWMESGRNTLAIIMSFAAYLSVIKS
jgi:hypothetical protein